MANEDTIPADTRTAARDAAYAFINDPKNSKDIDNPLALIGMVAMLFPDVKIDWSAAGMIVGAIARMNDNG